jgi:hypothetical protein
MRLWRIACASAEEVDRHLELLPRAGPVNSTRATEAIEAFDDVRAMTWRLLNPGKRPNVSSAPHPAAVAENCR